MYPRREVVCAPSRSCFCGASSSGDLQVGWIFKTNSSLPVYMQSRKISTMGEIESFLYFYDTENEQRQMLTAPFQISHIESFDFWGQVTARQQHSFRSLTFVPIDFGGAGNTPSISRESFLTYFYSHVVPPKGGTLVIFDSVSLPHSVDATLTSTRLAIGGWWHELTAALKHRHSEDVLL